MDHDFAKMNQDATVHTNQPKYYISKTAELSKKYNFPLKSRDKFTVYASINSGHILFSLLR